MKTFILRRLGLLLGLIVGITAGAVREAAGAAVDSSGELLSAELPAGITIMSAPIRVLAPAMQSAIRKNFDKTVAIYRTAFLSRLRRDTRRQVTQETICDDFVVLTRAALEAAPKLARAIVEEATRLAPQCAREFYNLLGEGGEGGSLPAFGTGYVLPGFAGAPGFSGSNPGGGMFVPVTPIGNR